MSQQLSEEYIKRHIENAKKWKIDIEEEHKKSHQESINQLETLCRKLDWTIKMEEISKEIQDTIKLQDDDKELKD